jgi:hypothetical protein
MLLFVRISIWHDVPNGVSLKSIYDSANSILDFGNLIIELTPECWTQ